MSQVRRNEFQIVSSQGRVYVRVVGLGNMRNAMTFRAFIDRMRQDGCSRIVVDLVDCQGLDSTFMGVLLSLHQNDTTAAELIVLNANPHCWQQLASIGLDRVLTIRQEPQAIPANAPVYTLPEFEVSPHERLKLIRKAHRELVAFDKRNEAHFAALLKDLDDRLGPSD